ncbi:MAG: hypothetical protein NTW78_01440 [Campylobacterales bacterium]|nr:hypothetical protein [Campylobacterales bacterium]
MLATGDANNASALAINIDLSGTSNYAHLEVGAAGANYATAPSNVITNAVANDEIIFKNDTSCAHLYEVTTTGNGVAADIAALMYVLNLHVNTCTYVISGDNTYVAESVGNVGAGDTTLIELTGVHSFTASTGSITVAS